MSAFEFFHPFLQSHEVPNKNSKETSAQEAVLDESEKEIEKISINKNLFQPHDKRLVNGAMPFSTSGIANYIETESENKLEKETLQESEEQHQEKTSAKILNFPQKERPFDEHIKPSFYSNPALRENAELHQKTEIKAKAEENIRLFRSANVEKITNFLLDDKIIDFEFAKEIEATKKEYATQLADATFLNQLDWKLLTALRLFHKETFEHSIGTYLIAKDKIDRIRIIKDHILNEGVSIEQFLRSCLLHDIGKIAVPEFILNKRASNLDWVAGLFEMFNNDDDLITDFLAEKEIIIPDEFRENPNDMVSYMEEKRIRAVNFVPAKVLFTENEMKTLRKIFPSMDENATLKDFIAIHESISRDILVKCGMIMEGYLAGSHHNHRSKDKVLGEKSSSLTSLFLSETLGDKKLSTTIIHLSDMTHALKGKRSYHDPHSILRTLSFCIDAANDDEINPQETIVWILDELSPMDKDDLEKIKNMEYPDSTKEKLEEQKNDLETIEGFLQKYIG